MTLPVQTIIDTHEALSDWKFTAQEANQVIASVGESLTGAIVLAAMMGVFSMVVGGNPGKEHIVEVKITSEPTPRPEGGTRFYADVYDESGAYVLESIYDELPDRIVLTSRYAKPGYALKGYGKKAFIEGPLALAIKTGKPMMTTSLSPGGREFYEALQKKGLVSISKNTDPEWYKGSLIVRPTGKESTTYSNPTNPKELLAPTISEIQGNITVSILGIRAVAELSVLSPPDASLYGVDPNNWVWFNRLINQSGIPRVGTLLLDAVLNYCKEKNYSILNQVSAYGDVKQKELEGWYIRKGFSPVNYKKYGNALLKWTPSNPKSASTKLYHCTDESNVDGIMRNGLLSSESASEMTFFFPNLQVAEEAGLSGMAILEVSITDDEVDKCIIGETFPDLYIGRYGSEPPADTTLREYIRNPIAYGIPEVCCTISKIPANRIKYVKTIRR